MAFLRKGTTQFSGKPKVNKQVMDVTGLLSGDISSLLSIFHDEAVNSSASLKIIA